MKVLGLILEINPLHNGHVYFIKKAIEEIKPDYTICVISTNFTSRGEISVINKFDKTKYLLDLGIDLVLENPFIGYNCSADYFAYNSINILNKFKVTDIAFGVELYDLDMLKNLERISSSSSFDAKIKEYLDKGFSYSTAANKAVLELTNNPNYALEYSKPNNTLAIQYIRSINKINNGINIHLIKRIDNDYFDEKTSGKLSSATSLRNRIKNNLSIDEFTPYKLNIIDLNEANNNIFKLLKYKVINNDLNYLGVKEGFENRLSSETLKNYKSIEELIDNCETKRYKTNYIKRVIMNIITNLDSNTNQKIDYLRVLGFNAKGNKLISKLDKETKKKIITLPKLSESKILDNEIMTTKLYGLITNNFNLYLEEYKIPIRKE